LYAEFVAKKEKKDKKAAKADAEKNERVVAENRKARHNYHVLDTLECGIMLVGSYRLMADGYQLSPNPREALEELQLGAAADD
jgi:hypothetical protein